MNDSKRTIISSVLISFSIIFLALVLAVNNRYLKLDNQMILDKWTKKIHFTITGETMGELKDKPTSVEK